MCAAKRRKDQSNDDYGVEEEGDSDEGDESGEDGDQDWSQFNPYVKGSADKKMYNEGQCVRV
ncbi:MAG: hypothetical protein GY814_06100 [Gammaproteobacteria bacterium]|nr:hypothetical protein [Gammaproteobacteria bacterium]